MAYRLTPDHGHRPRRRATDPAHVSRRRRAARRTVAVLPSLFTLGNLVCGFFSVFLASRPQDMELPFHWTPLTYAAGLVFVGMMMDALDGQVARLTRSTSNLGAQLDSLADVVTFGVAPAFMAVQLVRIDVPYIGAEAPDMFSFHLARFTLVVAAIYVSCAALRLARFNVEIHKPTESDHSTFKGLPSPGAAGTVASLVLLHQHFVAKLADPTSWLIDTTRVGMVVIMLLVAFAMVSKLRYVHLANKYSKGRMGVTKLARVVIAILLLTVWFQISLATGFVLYALSAPALWVLRVVTGKPFGVYPPHVGANVSEVIASDAPSIPSSEDARHRESGTA